MVIYQNGIRGMRWLPCGLFWLLTVYIPLEAQTLLPFTENGKWGYLNDKGDTVVQAKYDFAKMPIGDLARVNVGGRNTGTNVEGGMWGWLDSRGREVVPPRYREIGDLQEGLVLVREGAVHGYLDADGKTKIEPRFVLATPFSGNVALVQLNAPSGAREWHVLSRKGQLLKKLDADPLPETLHEGYFVVKQPVAGGFLYGVAHHARGVVVQPQFRWVKILTANLAAFYDKPADNPNANQSKWGLIRLEDGQVISPAVFEYVGPEANGLVAAMRDRRTAYYDTDGRMVILPAYYGLDMRNGRAPIWVEGKWGYLDRTGRVSIQPEFEAVSPWGTASGGVQKGKLWGLVDTAGRLIVEPQYDSLRMLPNGYAVVFRVDAYGERGYGVLAPNGAIVLKPEHGRVEWMGSTFRTATRTDLWGYINRDGDYFLPPEFDFARPFSAGWSVVKLGKRFGAVSDAGLRIEAVYDTIGDYSEGLACFSESGLWGYFNIAGDKAIEARFSGAGDFRQGLAPAANSEGVWGFINPQGEWAIAPRFAQAGPFANNLAPVKAGHKWGYISPNGRFAILPRYTMAFPFSEGRAAVSTYGDYIGYIDTAGAKILHEVFHPQSAFPFQEGLANVSRNLTKWHYADASGNRLIAWGEFAAASPFREGLACVALPSFQYSYINKLGQLALTPMQVDTSHLQMPLQALVELCVFTKGYAPRMVKGAWGYILPNGSWAIQPRFGKVGPFSESLAPAQASAAETRYYYYKLTGQLISPFTP